MSSKNKRVLYKRSHEMRRLEGKYVSADIETGGRTIGVSGPLRLVTGQPWFNGFYIGQQFLPLGGIDEIDTERGYVHVDRNYVEKKGKYGKVA